MRLILPVPLSPNRWARNPWLRQRQKDDYRTSVWSAAIQQQRPTLEPPARVVVAATFYLARHLRDEDNLRGSLKDVLDALKQKQTGKMLWRHGVADLCGYFVDDDPTHMTLAAVDQIKVPTVREVKLVVTLEAA